MSVAHNSLLSIIGQQVIVLPEVAIYFAFQCSLQQCSGSFLGYLADCIIHCINGLQFLMISGRFLLGHTSLLQVILLLSEGYALFLFSSTQIYSTPT
ncbi:hypothetical protein AU468_10445 [Alkalispirochaeta sphaeroplastigenens]|uniref:Uncharacterized protein n=1 Tax=Alkalispirochaeta sphaeroplastigenens TaxID=1187066 RepID=A0A2S4JI07_9SPIO|nr:hypothetical protein AU468_10445 [Alkalispirochaeta sphaeroplastigenens]